MAAKGFAADVNTNAPPGESRQGDYNTQEETLKEGDTFTLYSLPPSM